MAKVISAEEAHRQVHGPEEVGFLDVREVGVFSEGHPLFAASLPYSVLEDRVDRIVPNRTAPLLLIDGDDGTAIAAADALAGMEFSNISIVGGGVRGWENAGFTLFEGVHVPSKTLGELAFERWKPPTLKPSELYEWQKEGKNFTLLDCRPHSEFRKMTVPGATCMPTGEIVNSFSTLDTRAPIVITCAGRTRSIIGVCSLSLIAQDREILALENGTQGWSLFGRELEGGTEAVNSPPLAEQAKIDARKRAEAMIARFGINSVDAEFAKKFLGSDERTTYYFDVRSETEADADPLDAFDAITVGQLVQTTDLKAGVRRARMVLADDFGLRASVAAFWLRALGFEVHVAIIDDRLRELRRVGLPGPRQFESTELEADSSLSEVRGGSARFIDVRSSAAFSKASVAGSEWCSRFRIRELSPAPKWLIVGDDGPQAEPAAREFSRLGGRRYAIVSGGFEALRLAGAPIQAGKNFPAAEPIDEIRFASGRHDGDLQASRRYLDWEKGLVSRLSGSERAEFAI
ncbi:MAG: rhodanese-like domain-containing protein [Albidovulum sp.]|nr:rhodanese-like domain-containing protein [Albidovulum sp.]